MNLTLGPELERFVAEQVASGQYQRPEDVIVDGLRALRDRLEERRQKLEALRADVDVALEQSRAGLSIPFDESVLDEIKARGRERLAAKGKPT